MLKHLIISFCLFIFILSANSQDTITKTNGQLIECKLVEVTNMVVKCHYINSPDKTIYSIALKDVYKIKYEDGTEEYIRYHDPAELTFNIEPLTINKGAWGSYEFWLGDRKLGTTEIRALFGTCQEALGKFNKGKKIRTASSVIGIPSGFVFGWTLGTMIAGGDANATMLIIGGVGTLTSIILNISGANALKESVRLFNNSIKDQASLKLGFGFTQYGLGVKMVF